MKAIIIGGAPPNAFFKMRKNRIDSASRIAMQAPSNIAELLRQAGAMIVTDVIGDSEPTLSMGVVEKKTLQ